VAVPFKGDDPAFWEARAEETRAIMQKVTDPQSRRLLVTVAESYDGRTDPQPTFGWDITRSAIGIAGDEGAAPEGRPAVFDANQNTAIPSVVGG
jgi:hypothetical protein